MTWPEASGLSRTIELASCSSAEESTSNHTYLATKIPEDPFTDNACFWGKSAFALREKTTTSGNPVTSLLLKLISGQLDVEDLDIDTVELLAEVKR